MSTRVTSPVATASFPALFEATAFAGAEPKYSITLLWDKDEDLSSLKAACDAAAEKKWGADRPANLAYPMKDGDGKLDKDGNQRAEYKGKKFLTAKAKESDRPKIVDVELNPVLDKTLVYGGCEVRVAISFFGWSFGGKHGISAYLGNVQLVGPGQPFGTTNSVESDFGGF